MCGSTVVAEPDQTNRAEHDACPQLEAADRNKYSWTVGISLYTVLSALVCMNLSGCWPTLEGVRIVLSITICSYIQERPGSVTLYAFLAGAGFGFPAASADAARQGSQGAPSVV